MRACCDTQLPRLDCGVCPSPLLSTNIRGDGGEREVGVGKGEMGDGVTVPVGGEVCKNVRGEWHRVNGKKQKTVLLRHYRSGGLVSGGCPRAAFL